MARGLTTPTILIFVGVIGGAFCHGLIGLFLGPIILGVFYDFVVAWAMQRKAAVPADVAFETKGGERSP
jgi:predicted PurR-regulated permease PerM